MVYFPPRQDSEILVFVVSCLQGSSVLDARLVYCNISEVSLQTPALFHPLSMEKCSKEEGKED